MEYYDNERFLYTVYPKRPIKNLNENINLIRTPRSLFLNKEEVAKCFEYGTVYRRFSNQGIVEKFNKYEIDRVHRPTYISAKEWKSIKEGNDFVNDLVVNGAKAEEVVVVPEVATPVVEEKIEEVPLAVAEEVVAEPVVEEVTVETEPVEEEIADEGISVLETEEITESTEEDTAEDTDIEAVEEEVSDNNGERPQHPQLNYNKKKKHH